VSSPAANAFNLMAVSSLIRIAFIIHLHPF
jgi:hypothetical protein